jgi:putative nucleotidyltransferase with HDIG domain
MEMATGVIENRVKQVISNIRNLPTPPIVFHQIQKVISDPKVSSSQIAAILAEDPAMSVKVLKLTNSAFYGLSREIESVKEAVVIVGLEAIRNLVLSASVLDMFKGKAQDVEFQERFWRHSLATAFCSRIMARRLRHRGMVDPDAAFSAGLLHDIGKIVLCCFLSAEYKAFDEAREKDSISPTYEVETSVLGYNHTQIGSLLASQWKLPHKIVEAVAYHHSPHIDDGSDPIAFVVYLGNLVAKRAFLDPHSEAHLIGEVDPRVLEYMNVTDEDLKYYAEQLKQEYAKAETFMKMVGLS